VDHKPDEAIRWIKLAGSSSTHHARNSGGPTGGDFSRQISIDQEARTFTLLKEN
jgi:hypothetical protein